MPVEHHRTDDAASARFGAAGDFVATECGRVVDSALLRLSPQRLAIEDVHLWFLNADADAVDLQLLGAVLCDAERLRAKRIVRDRDRRRFILAHGALRLVLAAYADRPAKAMEFVAGVSGKPSLAEPVVEFNLSHSADAVLIGVASCGCRLGVDIEQQCRIEDLDALAEICFSAEEAAAWRRLPVAEQEAGFFRHWTVKEALLKAAGDGLSRSPEGFTIGFNDSFAVLEPDPTRWSLHRLKIELGSAAAVAIDHPQPNLMFRRLTLGAPRKV